MSNPSPDVANARPDPGSSPAAREATLGSAIKLSADALGRVLSLAVTVVVAQRLGPAGFGVFAALSVVAVLVADLSDLGLQLTATHALVARTLRLRDVVKARLVLTAFTAGLAAFAAKMSPAFAVLVLYFILSNWCEFSGVTLRVRGRRLQEALVLASLRAVCLVFVVLAGASLLNICRAHVLSTLPPFVLAGVLVTRAYRHETGPEPTAATAVIRGALRLGLNNLLTLANLRLELIVLFWMGSETQLGLFAAALRFIEFLVAVPAAIAAGAMPALTREALAGGSAARRRTAFTVALLAVPAAIGLAVVADDLMRFDVRFIAAAPLLRLLALAVMPLFMNGVMSYTLIAAGRGHLLPRLTAWRLFAACAFAAVLIPSLGPVGAAIGFIASEAILFVLLARSCRRSGVPVILLAPILTALALAFPMSAAVVLMQRGFLAKLLVATIDFGATVFLALALSRSLRRRFID